MLMNTATSTVLPFSQTRSAARSPQLMPPSLINYTDQITALMQDIIERVPALGHINLGRVLVFARFGRSDAEGAYATCHAISLPSSEPSYYFWRDRQTGRMTRRSEWFVTKSPEVPPSGTARM